MGWPVGRVLYAEAWRPSIYDGRCRPPPAVYPRTRAGRPQSCARPGPEGSGLLDLAPGGVCRAGRVTPVAGGLLHRRFTLTSRCREAVCSLWHFPASYLGWVLPTTLPCGARTFLGAVPLGTTTRSPGQPIRRARIGPAAGGVPIVCKRARAGSDPRWPCGRARSVRARRDCRRSNRESGDRFDSGLGHWIAELLG